MEMYLTGRLAALLLKTMPVLSIVFWIFAVTRLLRLSVAERSRKDKLAVNLYGVQICATITSWGLGSIVQGSRINYILINALFLVLAGLILALTLISLGVADKTSAVGRRVVTAAILWLSTIGLALVMPTV